VAKEEDDRKPLSDVEGSKPDQTKTTEDLSGVVLRKKPASGTKEEETPQTSHLGELRKRTLTKTRKYMVNGAEIMSKVSKVVTTGMEDKKQREYQLWKADLRELRMLHKIENRDVQQLDAKAAQVNEEHLRKYDASIQQVLRTYDYDLEMMTKQHKQQVDKNNATQQLEIKNLQKKLKYDQDRELKVFQDGLKQEIKLLKQDTDLLPKDQRKEVFERRKTDKDVDHLARTKKLLKEQEECMERAVKRLTETHREKAKLTEKQFLQNKHQLLRSRDQSIWDLEERHQQEKHQLSEAALKEKFILKRNHMMSRHAKEIEQVQRINTAKEDEMNQVHMLERKRLPKILKADAKTRSIMFKESLRISVMVVTDERDKIKQFERAEREREKEATLRLEAKLRKQFDELRAKNSTLIKELEQVHVEKKKMLLDNEKLRMEELYSKNMEEMEAWKSQLITRKQTLEAMFVHQCAEQDKFYANGSQSCLSSLVLSTPIAVPSATTSAHAVSDEAACKTSLVHSEPNVSAKVEPCVLAEAATCIPAKVDPGIPAPAETCALVEGESGKSAEPGHIVSQAEPTSEFSGMQTLGESQQATIIPNDESVHEDLPSKKDKSEVKSGEGEPLIKSVDAEVVDITSEAREDAEVKPDEVKVVVEASPSEGELDLNKLHDLAKEHTIDVAAVSVVTSADKGDSSELTSELCDVEKNLKNDVMQESEQVISGACESGAGMNASHNNNDLSENKELSSLLSKNESESPAVESVTAVASSDEVKSEPAVDSKTASTVEQIVSPSDSGITSVSEMSDDDKVTIDPVGQIPQSSPEVSKESLSPSDAEQDLEKSLDLVLAENKSESPVPCAVGSSMSTANEQPSPQVEESVMKCSELSELVESSAKQLTDEKSAVETAESQEEVGEASAPDSLDNQPDQQTESDSEVKPPKKATKSKTSKKKKKADMPKNKSQKSKKEKKADIPENKCDIPENKSEKSKKKADKSKNKSKKSKMKVNFSSGSSSSSSSDSSSDSSSESTDSSSVKSEMSDDKPDDIKETQNVIPTPLNGSEIPADENHSKAPVSETLESPLIQSKSFSPDASIATPELNKLPGLSTVLLDSEVIEESDSVPSAPAESSEVKRNETTSQ